MISYVADNSGTCATAMLLSRRKYRCNNLSPHTGQGKRRRNAATAARVERENAALEAALVKAGEALGRAMDQSIEEEQAKRERKNAAARARRAKAKLEAQARAEVMA